MAHYTLYFDGSCWPNPGGRAGYGYTVTCGELRLTGSKEIGTGPSMSNNLAEFCALGAGLVCLRDVVHKGDSINARGDSRLVIQMITKQWRARSNKLYWPAYLETLKVLTDIRKKGVSVTFDWVPRELNQEADDLSKIMSF